MTCGQLRFQHSNTLNYTISLFYFTKTVNNAITINSWATGSDHLWISQLCYGRLWIIDHNAVVVLLCTYCIRYMLSSNWPFNKIRPQKSSWIKLGSIVVVYIRSTRPLGKLPVGSVTATNFPPSKSKMFVPNKKVGTLSERPDSIEYPALSHTESTDKLMEENNISWLEFVRRSTCAALTHLGERPQSTIVKIIWGSTLIIGLALTAVSTYYSTTAYINVSGSSEMSLQPSPTAWIEHPKYHICTSNNFNSTVLAGLIWQFIIFDLYL